MKFGNVNIGGMSFGSTRIGGAKYGNALVFQSGGQPQPTTIPYIRGGVDGEYIDTGITADNTVRVIVWARNFNPATGFIFGSRVASAQSAYCLGSHAAANTGRIRVDYNNTNNTYADNQWHNLSWYHKYELDGGVVKVDDVVVCSATQATFSNNYNIHLLGCNNAGTHMGISFPIDICKAQIYKGGNLVRDFTAVNSPSVGLYDSVSQTLFTNAGGGSLTYGTFNPNAYTPLEYIECDGNQYFDSGVYGGYANRITAKFRYTNNTQNASLLGCRSSNDWCEFDINYGSTIKMLYRLASDATWRKMYDATSANFVDKDIILVKGNTNSASIYTNNAQIGSTISPTSSSSYVSSLTMAVGAIILSDHFGQPFVGRLYFVALAADRNYVPALVNNVAGMYDTYNDVFKSSESGTPFIAGPTL